MDDLAQVITFYECSVRGCQDTVARVVSCGPQVHGYACLFDEEAYDVHVQVEEPFVPPVENGEKFVLIVLEIGGCHVCRCDGPLVLLEPRLGPVNLDFRYRLLMGPAFMNDGEGECLYSVSSIEAASVAVGLLLEVLAGFYINDGRRQLW